jgi:hypothetical protein
MHDDRTNTDEAPSGSETAKRPYRRPDLRELGPLADLTQATNAGGPGADSTYATSQ